jgi:hypothetical protein
MAWGFIIGFTPLIALVMRYKDSVYFTRFLGITTNHSINDWDHGTD